MTFKIDYFEVVLTIQKHRILEIKSKLSHNHSLLNVLAKIYNSIKVKLIYYHHLFSTKRPKSRNHLCQVKMN